MRPGNLKIIVAQDRSDDRPNTVVEVDGARVYCNGHIIVTAPSLSIAVRSLSSKMTPEQSTVKVADKFTSSQNSTSAVAVTEGAMLGSFVRYGYIRKFSCDSRDVYISERYRRLFNEDAAFKLDEENVLVFERGSLVGVVRPVGVKESDGWPLCPFVEDEVLYHSCEEAGYGC